MIQEFLAWAKKTGDSRDHTAEVIEYAYSGTVILAWIWLTHGVYKGKGFDTGWNQAFLTLAGMVALTKVNLPWANRGEKPDPPKPD